MPAPTSSTGLTLGRPLADMGAVETLDDLKDVVSNVIQAMIGMGWVAGAKGSDLVYQNVIARAGNFYGGKPSDPLNPDLLLSAAGGTIVVQDEGVALTARGIVNFIGASVTAVDNAGATRTDVTIVGGSSNSFETIVTDTGSVVADSSTDSLMLTGGDGITTTGTAGTDTITIDADIDTTRGLEFVGAKIAINEGKGIFFDSGAVAVEIVENSHLDFDAVGDAGKLQIDWDGMPGYVLGNKQTLTKDASAALPDYPEWVDSPQKVIWGIDPDGGHTITTTGTTLTLKLKVTKYTFDAVNFVSAVDADVDVVYTGTAC